MKSVIWAFALLLVPVGVFGQNPELKFVADTLVVQAEGTYDADPDLATLTFQIFAQDKDLKQAYAKASRSAQHIVEIAQNAGLNKDDIRSGALTVNPIYEGDRKKRARSYYVQGQEILRVRDFSKIGPILDSSVEDSITDFRSLNYSLADEEGAKKKAVAEAMKHAIGRASTALEEKGQKLGVLRYMSLDVKQIYGVASVNGLPMETLEVTAGSSNRREVPPPPPPPPPPQKITVSASVQCAFQIQ